MRKPWERPGIDKLVETIRKGSSTVFVAPTGYGKSKSVPRLLEESRSAGIAARVIHVLPLRALVEQQFMFLRSLLGSRAGFLAGLRLGHGDYSGFMLRKAVVSTLDSFSLNLARLPVAELSGVLRDVFEGHYELPRAAIFSSLTVLDEAHLYAEPWAEEPPLSRLFTELVLSVFSRAGLPVVVETATMPRGLVERIAKKTRGDIIAVCRDCCHDTRCTAIHDKEYEEEQSLAWRTSLVDKTSALHRAKELAETGRKVLVSVNTVGSAIEAYNYLTKHLGREDIVLVHGRLSATDREEAVKNIPGARIVVATQVIEAGVDVDAEALVTEAATPSSLAQRAGRLCRGKETLERCREEPPEVIIYEPEKPHPYGDAVPATLIQLEKLKQVGDGVEWRLLDDRVEDTGRLRSFRLLVESVEDKAWEKQVLGREQVAYLNLLYLSLTSISRASPRPAKLLLSHYCSLVRDSSLVTLAIPRDKDGYDYLDTSLGLLAKKADKILDCRGDRCRVLLIGYGDEVKEVEDTAPREKLLRALQSCSSYMSLYPGLVAEAARRHGLRGYQLLPVTRPGAYLRGIGLVA